MMSRFACLLFVLIAACSPAASSEPKAAEPVAPPTPSAVVHVAAASDLTRAFEELAKVFEAQTKQKVSFSFGSTGLLAKQIEQGAPFDVFAAANVSFVAELARSGVCDATTQAPYARGRIVVWSKNGVVPPPTKLEDLADPRFQRIAIANPEHAPYGKAAKEALEKVVLWKSVEPRVVYGENVKQTLQFASSGNAEVAIVALSLVLGTQDGSYVLVDDAQHAAIDQALIVCKNGKNRSGGAAFASFVNSAAGRLVMRRYGFALPGEALVSTP